MTSHNPDEARAAANTAAANEFYNLQGRKFSTSKNWTIPLEALTHLLALEEVGVHHLEGAAAMGLDVDDFVDGAHAEVLALPYIAEHKAKLLAARPRIEPVWRHQYEPGREHATPDGGRIIATDHELIHLDAKGVITGRSVNGGPGHAIFGLERRLGLPMPVGEPMIQFTDAKRPILATKNGDDAILETYLKHANVTGHFEREARNVWALYKTLTDSKPLRDSSRDDGRNLVAHFEAGGLKSATIQKKIGWLTAAVNLAIKENQLKFNPFSGIIPKRDDKASGCRSAKPT